MNRLVLSLADLRAASVRRPLRAVLAGALAAATLLFVALLGGVGFGSSSSSAAQYKPNGCTNDMLSGAYATASHGMLSPTGSLTPVGENTPRVQTGRLDFDGNGHATGVSYSNPPGTVSPDGNATPFIVTNFTYQVRPDCTGYSGSPSGGALAFVLIDVKGGVAGAFEFNQNRPGFYTSGRGTRIFPP
jgi:hypothetical protein